jgi:ribosomal protein S18 acetylase RimI-like enzyme
VPVIVRRARPEEFTAVGDLTLAAYVADGFLVEDDFYAVELRTAAARAAAAELMVAVEATSDDVLGTVTFCVHGSPYAEVSQLGEAEFRMLAVAPAARRRGIGNDLARWCVDRAREHGCRAVVLSSLGEMHTAHRLYERLGFRRLPERDWTPAPGVDLIAYRLGLDP